MKSKHTTQAAPSPQGMFATLADVCEIESIGAEPWVITPSQRRRAPWMLNSETPSERCHTIVHAASPPRKPLHFEIAGQESIDEPELSIRMVPGPTSVVCAVTSRAWMSVSVGV